MIDLGIVGGGISGLALGVFAKEHLQIALFEKNPTLGGVLQNSSTDDCVRDHAANGWLNNEPTVEHLLKIIDLDQQQIVANNHKSTRFLVQNNQLQALHPKILLSSLLSWKGLFGIISDLWKAPGRSDDESMAEFISRRFHPDLVDNFVAPMTAGIYACEPEELSVPAAFPNLWALEKEYGSLIKGMRKSKSPRGQLTTIQGGMGHLIQKLQEYLQSDIHCDQEIQYLERHCDHWIVQSNNQEWTCRNIALTCPAPSQAKLLQPLFPDLALQLQKIEYAPVAVVIQEFDATDFVELPQGFGALLTRSEREDGTLGILFTSHIFPSHAPKGTVTTRTILGGSIRPEVVTKSNQELMAIALKRHQQIFNSPNLQSTNTLVIKHPLGIPKYPKGHLQIQQYISQFHQKHPNIRLSGNHLFGVAIKDCIRNAHSISQHFAPNSL